MNRTGIPATHATQLFEAVNLLPAVKVVGLHAYDGQIRDTDVSNRKQHVDKGFSKVLILAATIEAITKQPLKLLQAVPPLFPSMQKELMWNAARVHLCFGIGVIKTGCQMNLLNMRRW